MSTLLIITEAPEVPSSNRSSQNCIVYASSITCIYLLNLDVRIITPHLFYPLVLVLLVYIKTSLVVSFLLAHHKQTDDTKTKKANLNIIYTMIDLVVQICNRTSPTCL